MYDMRPNHPERAAILCKHIMHPSAPPRAPLCPQCVISAAQTDLERARKKLEAEGGADAPAYMRDRAWNAARLQYASIKRRAKKTMQKDWWRQERERLWDEAHKWHLAQHGEIHADLGFTSPCIVCATLKKQSQRYGKLIVPLTTPWWEREGALMEEVIVVPETPSRLLAKTPHPLQLRARQPSYLADLIKSWRSMRTVSDEQRRIWEDRCKLDRAIRRKYDLPDDYELEPEILAHPLPASHARYHHRQIQNHEHAAERRVNRHKRSAEDYKPSRSSLALSELANDVKVDGAELERLRLEGEAAELRRLAGVTATEVGYLYFVGETDLLERWRDDLEISNLELIQRQIENGMSVGRMDEEHVETAEEIEEL